MRTKHLQYANKPNRKQRREAARKGSCPCGTDNDHQLGGNYQPTFDALTKIVEVSEAARREDTFKPALTAFVAKLREVAPVFGATGYKDLKGKLEAMMEQEAEWQREGYERKDNKAGEVHGGRRGLVQEAQHRIQLAQEHLATLKESEAKTAVAAKEKAKAKAAKAKPKRTKPAEAPVEVKIEIVKGQTKATIVGKDGAKLASVTVPGTTDEARGQATAYALSAAGFSDDPRVLERAKTDPTMARAVKIARKRAKPAT